MATKRAEGERQKIVRTQGGGFESNLSTSPVVYFNLKDCLVLVNQRDNGPCQHMHRILAQNLNR